MYTLISTNGHVARIMIPVIEVTVKKLKIRLYYHYYYDAIIDELFAKKL